MRLTENNRAVIIPARFQSSRFPGKPLVYICGASRHCKVCVKAKALDQLVIDQVHHQVSDNEKELTDNINIADKLNAKFYFAHSYDSWKRGLNENSNGLVREYFPRGMGFTAVTQKENNQIMSTLNNRSRKCLGAKTHDLSIVRIHSSVASAS